MKPVDAAPAAVVLPCLGRVDESLLAGLAAYKSFDATLACGNCDACAHTPGGILACDVVESAQSLVRAFGSPMTREVVEGLPERVASEAQAANETGNAHRVATPFAMRKNRAGKPPKPRCAKSLTSI